MKKIHDEQNVKIFYQSIVDLQCVYAAQHSYM